MPQDGLPRRALLKAVLASPLGAAALQACGADGAGLDAGTGRDGGFERDAGTVRDGGTIRDGGTVRDGGSSTCAVTGSDVEGPFYRAGAPSRMVLVDANEPGDALMLTGRVTTAACVPIAGALLDVWQADAAGIYDNDSVDFRLRGQLMSAADGTFEVHTIRPGAYRDGGGFRPAHIHFTVTYPTARALTTQLYFAGDPYLQPNDSCGSCASDDPTLIIDLTDPMDGTFRWTGHFEVVLDDA